MLERRMFSFGLAVRTAIRSVLVAKDDKFVFDRPPTKAVVG